MADQTPNPEDQARLSHYQSTNPGIKSAGPTTTEVDAAANQAGIPWGKEAGLVGNQLLIGAAGLPMTAARGAMGLGHLMAPSYVPEVPDIMYPGGPGGYENQWTYGPFAPTNPYERVLAAGARGAGAASPFGPRAMAIGGVGGGLGQTSNELGFDPRIGQTIDFVSGLGAGYTGLTRGGWRGPSRAAPTTAPAARPTPGVVDMSGVFGEEGSNVVPFPRGSAAPAPRPTPEPAPAAGGALPAATRASESDQMNQLIALEQRANQIAQAHLSQSTWAPLTRWLTPVGHALANRFLARGAFGPGGPAGPSVATSTAQRVLGIVGGGALGAIQGQDQGFQ